MSAERIGRLFCRGLCAVALLLAGCAFEGQDGQDRESAAPPALDAPAETGEPSPEAVRPRDDLQPVAAGSPADEIDLAGRPARPAAEAEPRMAASPVDRDRDGADDVSELDRRFDQAVSGISRFEYAQAEAILRPLVVRYRRAGKAGKVAQSMFWLAYCLEKQAEIESAAVLYREVIRSHDGTAAATQAARRLEQIRKAGQS